jgi:hypothetical protein
MRESLFERKLEQQGAYVLSEVVDMTRRVSRMITAMWMTDDLIL